MTDEITLDEIELKDQIAITSIEGLKAISDPNRVQILEMLLQGPRTVKQMAAEMETTPTKLYYHVNMLEEHGLIQVVSTRIVSGILEKQYYITARSITVDPAFFTPSGRDAAEQTEGVKLILSAVLDSTRADILQSVKVGLIKVGEPEGEDPVRKKFMLLRNLSRMPEEQAREFSARLEALLKEFDALDTGNESDQPYALTIAFFATTHSLVANRKGSKEANRDHHTTGSQQKGESGEEQ